MITQWEDLVGHKVTGVYHASYGIVLLIDDDEFAVIAGELGYEDDAYADLADDKNSEALGAAVVAKAPGAWELQDANTALMLQEFRETELRRLKYLQEKYPEEVKV